ncbi:MAG: glycosyltransferase [Eubacteriales bacterium]
MNVVYVAPRYHTNQVPIMKGWLEDGNQVTFISQYGAGSEDYKVVKPIFFGYSKIFKAILWLYKKATQKKNKLTAIPFLFQAQFGFPSVAKTIKILNRTNPDVIILRDRSVYNAVITQIAKFKKITCILYNQTPFYDKVEQPSDIFHKVIRSLTPKYRITPVKGTLGAETMVKEDSFYVPFVIEPVGTIEEKEHFINDEINIICVGKFEVVKQHLMLLEVCNRLRDAEKIHVTLVGEVTYESHKVYLKKVEDLIQELHMEDMVTIKKNQSREEVFEAYKNADIFILPSSTDVASISQVEAMACSLPVICSDSNGTACYIAHGENGYVFKNLDADDLYLQLEKIIVNREKILQMGQKSYVLVIENHSFENYKDSINQIISLDQK